LQEVSFSVLAIEVGGELNYDDLLLFAMPGLLRDMGHSARQDIFP